MAVIKLESPALPEIYLLSKCVHDRTQNPNERYNSCVWKHLLRNAIFSYTLLKSDGSTALYKTVLPSEKKIWKYKKLKKLILPGEFYVWKERIAVVSLLLYTHLVYNIY